MVSSMRPMLAGPSLLRRQVPNSMAALRGALATTTTSSSIAHFSTSLHARQPKSSPTVRSSVMQVPYGTTHASTAPSISRVAAKNTAKMTALMKRVTAAGRLAEKATGEERRKLRYEVLMGRTKAAKAAQVATSAQQKEELPSRRERRRADRVIRKAKQQEKKTQKSIYLRAGLTEKGASPFTRIEGQFKTYKPLTPGLRWVRHIVHPHLHKGPALRILTEAKRSTGGRNMHGRITVRGRGGGHKRRTRIVDFYRWESGEQTVLRIEYDPGRSAHIALIEHNTTKIKSYILACDGLRAGDTVQSYRLDKEALKRGTSATDTASDSALNLGMFRTQAIRPGNTLPLSLIPVGTTIHALSLVPNGRAKLVRSAGAYGQLVAFVNRPKSEVIQSSTAKEADAAMSVLPGSAPSETPAASGAVSQPPAPAAANSSEDAIYAQVKLQSGEIRLIKTTCCATIGRVSNSDHRLKRLGKAGRSRWLGIRPKVRGVAMNKVDHPHGGGRGKSKSNKHPRSIYGHKTKGPRTRKPGTRGGNMMVIKERPRGAEKGARV